MNAETAAILKKRARELASQNREECSDSVKFLDVVLFRIGTQLYGINSRRVINISKNARCFPIPCTPPHVLGVANIRGKILAVIDFASLNGINSKQQDNSPMIVVGDSNTEFAFYADKVVSNRELFEKDIQKETTNLEKINKKGWIKAITLDGIIIFDIEKILSDENIIVDIT